MTDLAALLSDLVDLVWPAVCAGCRVRGTPWCEACAGDLRAAGFEPGPRRVRPTPSPPGLPPVWAWGAYQGVVRTVLVSYKDRDRRDLARVLAPLLTAGLCLAVGDLVPDHGTPGGSDRGSRVLVVPVPSDGAAVRRRGDRPTSGLGRAALRAAGAQAAPRLQWAPCLSTVRRVGDQAGLGSAARAANLTGAFAVVPRWRPLVAGRRCVVVDDVMTTGATLAEAARALRACGAAGVAAATVAATARDPSRAGAGVERTASGPSSPRTKREPPGQTGPFGRSSR